MSDPAPVPAAASGPSGDGAADVVPLRVLVVDDNEANRKLLQAILKADGHQVVPAASGEEAVSLYQQHSPDMVLMDIMMPGMDGYEATRRIKRIAGGRYLPVIFLTALTDHQALARCVDCGGDDFLTKPFSRVLLRAKIAALTRTRELYETVKRQRDELSRHRQRQQEEFELAERVFRKITDHDGLKASNLRYVLAPKEIQNGDLLLAAHTPSGRQMVMLGDFTGHGLSAAIGAIPVGDLFYAMTGKGFRLRDIVLELNRKVYAKLPTNLFLAACLVEVDPLTGTATVWNGGVPDALIVGPDGVRARAKSCNLPLGVVENAALNSRVEVFDLLPGDRILIYSDGLVEACNWQREMFGEARLTAAVHEPEAGDDLFERVMSRLHEFRDGSPQCDDITMIELTYDPQAILCAARGVRAPETRGAAEWSLTLRFDAARLRSGDPVTTVLELLLHLEHLTESRTAIYTVVSELMNNALDYGVLGLDSGLKRAPDGFGAYYAQREQALANLQDGWIEVELRHRRQPDGGTLTICVADSGPGFDFARGRPVPHADTFAGRGIALASSLCERLEYHPPGNRVEAVYRWGA